MEAKRSNLTATDHLRARLREHQRENAPAPLKKREIPLVIPATPAERNWRHAMWEDRRQKVLKSLQQAGTSHFALLRFTECGSACTVQWSPSLKKARLRASYCHSRHCEPCMRAKANVIAGNLQRKLKERQPGSYRFITLTLKHTDSPLRDQVKKLLRCFKKLRQRKEWKTSQVGGVATLEVKWKPAGAIVGETGRQLQIDEWHPHLHVISEGNWIHWRELRDAWLQITCDSTGVDIRQVKDRRACLHYVTKYISKGCSPSVWNSDEAAAEWILSIKGIRTVSTYGTWRGISLTKPDNPANDWRPICTLQQLLDACARGEEWAQGMFRQLRPEKEPGQPRGPP